MDEWARHRVSDLETRGLLRVEDGNHGEYRPRRDEFMSAGTSFIRAADLAGGRVDFASAERINDVALARIRKGIGAPGDVLLSHKGTVGRTAFVPLDAPPFVCSPQTTFWRSLDVDKIDPGYLRYFLESPDFVEQLRSRKGETDMADYVSLTEQRRLEVVLPPIEEQQTIAEVLGALDDKIESNRRIIDTGLALLEAEFNRVAEDTDDVPFDRVLRVEMGAPFSGSEFSTPPTGRPLIRIRDLKTFQPQVWTVERRGDEQVIHAGDVLVGMDAEFRSTLWRGATGVLNQRVCRFAPNPGVARAFAWLAIRADLAFFENAKSGTTVIHLNKADISRFRVPNLSSEEHASFQRESEPIVERVIAASSETAVLSQLRNTLLPEMLSSRMRVLDAHPTAEAVT